MSDLRDNFYKEMNLTIWKSEEVMFKLAPENTQELKKKKLGVAFFMHRTHHEQRLWVKKEQEYQGSEKNSEVWKGYRELQEYRQG